jgi:hypothetical protein
VRLPRFKNIGPTQEFLIPGNDEEDTENRGKNRFKRAIFKVNIKI